MYQKNQGNKIILTFESGTILTRFSTHISKRNISNNTNEPQQQQEINNQQVFECLINTVPQNTTINQHQTHNTIQNLEFGAYALVV